MAVTAAEAVITQQHPHGALLGTSTHTTMLLMSSPNPVRLCPCIAPLTPAPLQNRTHSYIHSALKTKGNTPKYGLIFHSSFIGRAKARIKGRISRYLANKCSIASRIDCFMDTATSAFGEKLKDQVEERLRFYEEGVAPRKNITVMQVRRHVVLEALCCTCRRVLHSLQHGGRVVTCMGVLKFVGLHIVHTCCCCCGVCLVCVCEVPRDTTLLMALSEPHPGLVPPPYPPPLAGSPGEVQGPAG